VDPDTEVSRKLKEIWGSTPLVPDSLREVREVLTKEMDRGEGHEFTISIPLNERSLWMREVEDHMVEDPIPMPSRKQRVMVACRLSNNREKALAIVWAFRRPRKYLWGAPRGRVRTDHANLRWLMELEHTGRLARWQMQLSVYDFETEHLKPSHMPGLLAAPRESKDGKGPPGGMVFVAQEARHERIKDTPCCAGTNGWRHRWCGKKWPMKRHTSWKR
jgi:hypothetical protein